MSTIAHWAIKNKLSGDTSDYRVLAASEGLLDKKGFENIFSLWQTGEMPFSENDDDPGEPWFTFAPLKIKENAFYLVLREKWTDRVDYRTRRIKISECLLIPLDDIASGPFLLEDLIALLENNAMVDARERIARGIIPEKAVPVEISLHQDNRLLERASSSIEMLKFDRCATIAGLLLKGSVALLTSPRSLGWEERISALDAISALLPSSMHKRLSLSIWAQKASMGRINLTFCRSSRDDRSNYAWPDMAMRSSSALDEWILRYSDSLQKLNKHHSTLDIARHLARQKETCNKPEDAVMALEVMDRARLTYEQAVNPDKRFVVPDLYAIVRLILFQEEGKELDGIQRAALLKALILNDFTQKDVEPVQGKWTEDLASVLQKAALSSLGGGEQDQKYREALFELAIRVGQVSEIFQKAMKSVIAEPDKKLREEREENLVTLLNSALFMKEKNEGLVKICDWLIEAEVPVLFFYSWAGHLYETKEADDREFRRVLRARKDGVEIQLLKIVWGMDEAQITRDMINRVNAVDSRYPETLATIAIEKGTLPKYINPFAEFLLFREDNKEGKANNNILEFLTNASKKPITYKAYASLDILRIVFYDNNILDKTPLGLHDAIDRWPDSYFQAYAESFANLFSGAITGREKLINRSTKLVSKHSTWTKMGSQDKRIAYLKEQLEKAANNRAPVSGQAAITSHVTGSTQAMVSKQATISSQTAVSSEAVVPNQAAYSEPFVPDFETMLAKQFPVKDIAAECARMITEADANDSMGGKVERWDREIAKIIQAFGKKGYPKYATDYIDLLDIMTKNLSYNQLMDFETELCETILGKKQLLYGRENHDFSHEISSRIHWRLHNIKRMATLFDKEYFPDDWKALTQQVSQIDGNVPKDGKHGH